MQVTEISSGMYMSKMKKFDWKIFIKAVASLAIPVAMQNLLTSTGSMVDTMMIASLGKTNVAAVGLAAQFSSLMFSCYWGFVGGGCLFFSQYYGAEDDKGVCRSFGVTISFMMLVAFIFGGFAMLFPHAAMSIYTDKENIRQVGVSYLRIVGVAYLFQVASMGASALLRSTEKVRIPLIASIVSVVTNIVLNYFLIFDHFGYKGLGIQGAAIATVIAAVVNFVILLLAAKATGYPYLFRFRDQFRWNRAFIRLYLEKCFPIICNELLAGLGFMVINIVLGHQSESAIAAVAVFRTIEGLVIGFFAGFSSASSVLVGTSVGAGEHKRAFERAKRIVYLCQGVIAAVIILVWILHAPLLHMMSLTGESFEICRGMLFIYGVAAIIRMGNWTQNDTYRAAGDAVTGTTLEIGCMWIMVIPLVVLSGSVFQWPFLLTFGLCYVDEILRYVLMQIHMYSGKWIRPVTPEGKASLREFMDSEKLIRGLGFMEKFEQLLSKISGKSKHHA